MKKNNVYLILILALLLGQNGISNANSGDPMNINTKALDKIEVEAKDKKEMGGYCDSKPLGNEKILNPDLEETQKDEKEIIVHTVQKGESLSLIALKYLGDAQRWPELIDLNKEDYPSIEKNPNLIYAGWQIKVALDKKENTDTDTTTNTEVKTDTEDPNKPNVVIDDNNVKPEEEIVKGPVWTIEQKITKLQDAVDKMNKMLFAAGRGDFIKEINTYTVKRMINNNVLTQEDWMAMNPPIGYTYVIVNSKVILIDSRNVALTSDDIAKLDKELADKNTRRNNTNTNTNTNTKTNPNNNSWNLTTITKVATDSINVISPRTNTNTNTRINTNIINTKLDPRDPRSKLEPITITKTHTNTYTKTKTNTYTKTKTNTNTNINIKPDNPSNFWENEYRLRETMTRTFTFTDINIDPRDPRSKLGPITYTKTNTNTNTKTKTNTNTNTNTNNNDNTKTKIYTIIKTDTKTKTIIDTKIKTHIDFEDILNEIPKGPRDPRDPRDPRSKLGTLTHTWTYYNTNTRTNTSVATPTYVNNGSNQNVNSSVATPTYVNNGSNSNKGDNRNTPASNLGKSLGDLFKAVQDAGKEIGQAGKELGKTVSDAGKGIAQDFKDMGQEFKKAGQDIADEVKQTGKDIADGAKQTGQEFKKAGQDIADDFKQVGEDFEDGFNRGRTGRDNYRRGSHSGHGRRR